MSSSEAGDELARSKALLEERLGIHITAFAYPFGTRADYNREIADLARSCGYSCAFTSQHGAIRRGDDAFVLNRVKVESGEPLATYAALVHGGLDAWRWIDRGFWRMQASRAP